MIRKGNSRVTGARELRNRTRLNDIGFIRITRAHCERITHATGGDCKEYNRIITGEKARVIALNLDSLLCSIEVLRGLAYEDAQKLKDATPVLKRLAEKALQAEQVNN